MTLTQTGDAPDDAALIARWRGGDERAATDLVERHALPLARFVSSLGARHDVEELVQDTFVRAFASLDGFRGQSTLRTWLFTIARNLMRDRLRAVMGRAEEGELEDSQVATGHDALDQLVADETADRLRRAVKSLTPMQRDVFTLRVTQGFSYREIADVLGSTEGAARVHYYNAVQAIKDEIND